MTDDTTSRLKDETRQPSRIDDVIGEQFDILMGMLLDAHVYFRFLGYGSASLVLVTCASSVVDVSRQNDATSAVTLAWVSAQLACLLVCTTTPLCIAWLLMRCLGRSQVRFSTGFKGIGDFIGRGTGLGFILGVVLVAVSVARPDVNHNPAHPMDLTVTIGVCSIGAALISVPCALVRELARTTRDAELLRHVSIALVTGSVMLATFLSTQLLHLLPEECFRYFLGPNMDPVITHFVSRTERPNARQELLDSLGSGSVSGVWFFWILTGTVVFAGLLTALRDWCHDGDRPRNAAQTGTRDAGD